MAAIVLLSLLTLAPKQVVQSISCRSASSLSESRSVTGSYSRCYRFTVPRNRSLLQIKLESSSGAADLYVRQGKVSSLSGGDKVTASATTGKATYVLLNPAATTYTIAVAPSSRGKFRLMATTSSSRRSGASLSCSRSSCTASYRLGRSIRLGSRYGDQLIFPIVIGDYGQVSATASWSGTVSRTARYLALYLHGPSTQPTQPLISYASRSGSSALSLSYTISSSVLRRGTNWQVTLVNNDRSGGSASGSLVIRYRR
jgi:hypothetical protein